MISRPVLIGLAPMLVGCRLVSSTEENPAAVTEQDQCVGSASNLEYTECWQRLAIEAASQVDEGYARALNAASMADEREYAGIDSERHLSLGEGVARSQVEWIEYVDQQCSVEGKTARGGTGTRALVAKCRHQKNLIRASELSGLIDAIENF